MSVDQETIINMKTSIRWNKYPLTVSVYLYIVTISVLTHLIPIYCSLAFADLKNYKQRMDNKHLDHQSIIEELVLIVACW